MADLSQYSDVDIINIVSSDAESELKSRGYDYGWYKKEPYVGSIYILVNPAFKELVKIGYADDVQKRMRTLNNNSGLPDPFHCYAVYKVKKRLEDLKLHGLIDTLDPSLRHSKNREFYEMDAEKAYSILSAIAQISGDEEQLMINPFNDEYFIKLNVDNQSSLFRNKAINTVQEHIIPNGTYYLKRKKQSDNKIVSATAVVNNGKWTLLKGSILGVIEDVGVSQKAKAVRASLLMDSNGKLLEDVELGNCSPSHAGVLVMNQSNNGWDDWKNSKGQPIDIYRKK